MCSCEWIANERMEEQGSNNNQAQPTTAGKPSGATGAVLLSIAALLIVVGSVASLSEILPLASDTTSAVAANAPIEATANSLSARRHGSWTSLRIVSHMSFNEMKAPT